MRCHSSDAKCHFEDDGLSLGESSEMSPRPNSPRQSHAANEQRLTGS